MFNKLTQKNLLKMGNKVKKEFILHAFKLDKDSYKGELKELFLCIRKIPNIITTFGKAENSMSKLCLRDFRKNKLDPFCIKFSSLLSKLTRQRKRIIGEDAYLDIRVNLAKFILINKRKNAQSVLDGLDLLLENEGQVTHKDINFPTDYLSMVFVLVCAIKAFNLLMEA